jgi:hypothetical protein
VIPNEERFFGHWTLTVTGRGSRVRLVLSGTDEVDGFYLPDTTQPFVLEASGAEWRMSGERLPRDSAAWKWLQARTASAWEPQIGLTRDIRWGYSYSSGADPGHIALVSMHRVTVNCRSHDPDLAAIPTPDPPEFTVPEKTDR